MTSHSRSSNGNGQTDVDDTVTIKVKDQNNIADNNDDTLASKPKC